MTIETKIMLEQLVNLKEEFLLAEYVQACKVLGHVTIHTLGFYGKEVIRAMEIFKFWYERYFINC